MPSLDTTPTAPWRFEAAISAAADRSVLDRWDRVVAEHSSEPALVDDSGTMTFLEADRVVSALATTFAATLRPDDRSGAGIDTEQGGGEVPVGIMVGQTSNAVLSIIGLVAAGRLVVVLDEHLPEARLRHVVALANIQELIVDEQRRGLAERVMPDAAAVRSFEPLLARARQQAAGDGPVPRPAGATDRRDRDGLVIVFTSGSTGMPKGVVMTHRQQLENVEQDAVALGLRPGDRLASVMPLSFAAGFLWALSALMNGAAIVLVDPRESGVERLLDLFPEERITTLICTPHLFRSLVAAAGPDDDRLRGLRFVATAGEPVTGSDVAAGRHLLAPDASFFNALGASEMGCIAYHEIRAGEPVPRGVVPAGHALPLKSLSVIREDGTTAGPGEAGELICASLGMTTGYWGAPEKTAERAGVTADGLPTWRQGDLARIDPDGTVTLLGRADDAVKVRGYLVEPSEIEAALRRIDDMLDAVVVAVVDESTAATRLVAYVVGRHDRRMPSPAAIRRTLRSELPEYMVPSAIVPMTALPRNERGKVSRGDLPPVPPVEVEMTERAYDQWELVVGQIWAEVLGLRGVPLDEDFAALGGDSLAAEEMLAAVEQRLGVDISSSDLLEYATLRAFTRRVRSGSDTGPSRSDIVKVSSAVEGTPTRPVFCIAGGGALALTFLPLSRHLSGHDVYAIQQHALERRGIPDWSVTASARRFLALMRAVQPEGPYLLVGHSLGGLVALEVARLLSDMREEVEHVVLLDTYLPGASSDAARAGFGRLEESPPARGRAGAAVAAVRTGVERSLRRVLPGGVPLGDEFMRHVRAYGAGVFRYEGQHHFDAFFDHAEITSRRHRVQPYDGRVTYVIAEGNPESAGWESLLRGQTNTVHIAAEHSSLLREPHVTEVAAVIREAFGDA